MKLLEHSINASFHSLVLSAKHYPPTAASLLETEPLKPYDLSSPPQPSHPPDCSGMSKQLCCSARNSQGTTTDVLFFGWNVYSLEAAVGLSPLERYRFRKYALVLDHPTPRDPWRWEQFKSESGPPRCWLKLMVWSQNELCFLTAPWWHRRSPGCHSSQLLGPAWPSSATALSTNPDAEASRWVRENVYHLAVYYNKILLDV